jgi:TolB-like protein/Tfp pilus assembly protein PilF
MKRSLFAELKRRNVIRAAILYVGSIWALAQGIAQLGPSFGMPEWGTRWFVIAGAVGFPFWVAFAWFFELTPEGLKLERDADEPTTPRSHGKFDVAIIAVLAIAVVLLLTDRFVLRHGVNAETAVAADKTGSGPVTASIPDIETDPSIAVLPMVNMSDDKGNEYFSDGISEELLNLLAKVPKLRVIARTSSFSFKGKDVPIQDIARALQVAAILEGSVRKQGGKVRITVQLIRTKDSSHLWSETYDRTLDDIFKVQDDISTAVVDVLKVKLLSGGVRLLPDVEHPAGLHRSGNAEAYDQYLLGKQYFNRSGKKNLEDSIAAYKQAIALDPRFAAAYAGLATSQHMLGAAYPASHDAKLALDAESRAGLRQALDIDPDLAEGVAVRGYLRLLADWDVAGAQSDLLHAIALNPGDSFAIKWYARSLATDGRLAEAITHMKRAADLDPLNAVTWANLGIFYNATGQLADADRALDRALELTTRNPGELLFLKGVTRLLQHDPAAALVWFRRQTGTDKPDRGGVAMAEHDLGHDAQSREALDALIKSRAEVDQYSIALVYAWRGEKDQAFEWLERAYTDHVGYMEALAYDPCLASLRSDARFGALMKKMNLKVVMASGPPGL